MPDVGSMMLSVFNGARQPISPDLELLVRVRDGFQDEFSKFIRGPNTFFPGLRVFDNFGDSYTVIVSASHFVQAGVFPVKISRGVLHPVSLMLLPSNGPFNFDTALLSNLQQTHRQFFDLFVHGAPDEPVANERYEQLMEEGKALDYFKELIWNKTMQRDRFFAFADKRLVEQINIAALQGAFAPSSTNSHPGATSTFKQLQFGEGNVQLSFHENQTATIDNVECVKVETDIDYFKDVAAHTILEVLPNFFTGGDTDPRKVYVLRWIDGLRAGIPEFNPPYTIVAS